MLDIHSNKVFSEIFIFPNFIDAVTLIHASKESFHMFRLVNRCHDFVHAYGIEV